jgi:hypothetical protein
MAGRNLFHESKRASAAALIGKPCVFVSHRKADKAEARDLVKTLIEGGVDVYFDEDDECLALADEDAAPDQVVQCIDAGLARCTHLLGLITSRTRGSWWVPYEIGATRAHNRRCAFVIHPDVESLPAYVRVAEVLLDRSALADWVPSLHKTASSSPSLKLLNILESLAFRSSPVFLPEHRTAGTINYE